VSRRSFLILLALVAVVVLVALAVPRERVLGSSVRLVYLHGAWVWAALLTFFGAAGVGLAAFLWRRDAWHAWSVGLARSATLFWVTSLLLSLAAMQVSWNGLYLAEPRWRLGVRFGLAAVLLQLAVTIVRRPRLGSVVNLIFIAALAAALVEAPSVMHPASPVFTSASAAVRLSFVALLAASLAAAVWLARNLRPHD
jgi:hypothetical protein